MDIGNNIQFERIRRITGYLVGTMDKWNDAKKAEAEKIRPDRRNLPQNPLSPESALYPPAPGVSPVAPSVTALESPLAPQPVGTSFQAGTTA